ncbi:MAG: hypothetical protein OSJ65_06140 [Bacilli bacterium]|nr:hypothetical protein [Bacilli bacterium]
MKKINYVGSLTKDIETIQNKEQEESTIPLVIKVFAVTIFFLTAMSICLHQFSSALIVPISSTLSALACAKSISASKFFARERAKTDASLRIMNLALKISELERQESLEKIVESQYSVIDIENAVVLSESISNPSENPFTKDDLSDYIEMVSDIYFINDHDKIKILREVKKCIALGNDYNIVHGSELFELEESEYPKKDKLPVKQVLKLRDDKFEKH